ncbi:hypothetical protein BCV70DRAFT_22597 [Testicularia cyperi]|uniref:Uncharacterized protein n=1 Tax=Testicularia cyperi TaxID=1882483 RepID=A0A317Y0T2_9BASI|nr:hypothetical protein BCV70DRAFT_22597 [Testicularia cyperi]
MCCTRRLDSNFEGFDSTRLDTPNQHIDCTPLLVHLALFCLLLLCTACTSSTPHVPLSHQLSDGTLRSRQAPASSICGIALVPPAFSARSYHTPFIDHESLRENCDLHALCAGSRPIVASDFITSRHQSITSDLTDDWISGAAHDSFSGHRFWSTGLSSLRIRSTATYNHSE